MAHYPGVCSKHQHLRSPVTDCEDCKERQQKQMMNEAVSL